MTFYRSCPVCGRPVPEPERWCSTACFRADGNDDPADYDLYAEDE